MRVRVPPPAPSGDQVSESGWSWARAVYPARESLFGGRHHRYLLSARLLGAASRRERAHLPARRGRGGRRLSGLPSLPPLPVAAVNELHRPGVGRDAPLARRRPEGSASRATECRPRGGVSRPPGSSTRVLDLRTYKLVRGGGEEFDRIFREGALPMLHRFGIEVVG